MKKNKNKMFRRVRKNPSKINKNKNKNRMFKIQNKNKLKKRNKLNFDLINY